MTDEFKKQNKKRKNNGQGLIEAIVSLSLLVVAILGALTLATLSVRAGTESRERVQAALLAQEAIEIVKNNRDTYCQIEGITWENLSNGANGNYPLLSVANFPSVGNLNGQVQGFENFNRRTEIRDISNEKKKIICTVSWGPNNQHSVKVIDYITYWQKVNQ